MKTSPLLHRRSHSRGGATLAVVAAISLALLSMLTYTVIASLNSFENQSSAQIKQDYSQKEDALLTALLHIVPNKAIGAMQEGSMDNQDDFTWATIFDEAISVANAEQSVSPNLLSSLNLDDAILANTGDAPIGEAIEIVKAPVRSYAGGDNLVNGGNWWEFYMLGDPTVGPSVPAPLEVSYDHYLLDKKFPIISFDKTYNYWYRKGVELPAEDYPLYNLITYPDVKFGYKRPGELFVTLRGGRDMSPFSKGFSVVTDMRLYIAETMNDVATSPPGASPPHAPPPHKRARMASLLPLSRKLRPVSGFERQN